METIYDVDYFINKFKSIPCNKWYAGMFRNPEDKSMKCAFGHCGLKEGNRLNKEALALEKLLKPLKVTHIYGSMIGFYKVATVNDGHAKEYKQSTPQERILSALHDVKKLQQTEKSETIVIEKIKYVSVSEIIKKEISLIGN